MITILLSSFLYASEFHLDIISLDTKNEYCRVVFEQNNIEAYKTVKCSELNDKQSEIYQWIKQIKK